MTQQKLARLKEEATEQVRQGKTANTLGQAAFDSYEDQGIRVKAGYEERAEMAREEQRAASGRQPNAPR